jgi:Outer membrane protein beta-barrel family/CarboxypepD_reg-like domain
MRIIIIVLTLIHLFQYQLSGQINRIEGQVIDSLTLTPVSYAIVQIEVDKNKITQITDDNGRFMFKNIILNQGIIQVKGLGFSSYENVVDMSNSKDKVLFLTIKLNQDVKNLSEVVVSSNRVIQKIDRTIYQFNDTEIKSASNSLQLLSLAPLLNVNTEGGILIRGKAGVQIFMDGKPILDERILKDFPAELISKVEIITNPGVEYETKKLSGIVNIITKTGWIGKYGNLSMQIGTNSTHNGFLFFSSKSKKIDLNLTTGVNTYSRMSNSEIQRILQNTKVSQSLEGKNESLQPSLSLGIGFKVDTNSSFSFYNNVYVPLFRNINFYNYYKPSNLNTVAEIDFVQNNNINTNNYSIKNYIDYTYQKAQSRLVLSFLAYNNITENDNYLEKREIEKKQSRQTNGSYLDEYSFQVDYSKTYTKKYSNNLGGKFISRTIFSKYALYNPDRITKQLVIDTSSIFSNNFKVNQDVFSLYFNNNIKVTNKLGTSFGLRCEYEFDGRNPFFFLPNFILQYAISDKKNIKINYRKKIFRPSINYLNPFINIADTRNNQTGNIFLLPELLNELSLSYDYAIKNHFLSFSLEYNFNTNGIHSFYELIDDNKLLVKQINLDKSTNIRFSPYYQLKVGKKFTASASFIVENNSLYFQNIIKNRWRILTNSNIAYFMPKRLTARVTANYASQPVLIQGQDYENSSIELSLGKTFNDQWSVTIFARDFLKMNSIRRTNIYGELFSQNDMKNLSLSVFAISASYSFGKRKYFYATDVKINNNDLKN